MPDELANRLPLVGRRKPDQEVLRLEEIAEAHGERARIRNAERARRRTGGKKGAIRSRSSPPTRRFSGKKPTPTTSLGLRFSPRATFPVEPV
jgi:hypothetical protein